MELFTAIDRIKSPYFKNTATNFEEFKDGTIWADLAKELQAWLADTWALLETEVDAEEAAQLRGRARTIREVLQMPDGIIHILKQVEEED